MLPTCFYCEDAKLNFTKSISKTHRAASFLLTKIRLKFKPTETGKTLK